MRIGITANLKSAITDSATRPEREKPGLALGEEEEEFDCPETLAALRTVFEDAGHDICFLTPDVQLLDEIRQNRVEFVFNLAEGKRGRSREAQIPALLELGKVPYSGSDPVALAMTLDKPLAKLACRGVGVPTADFTVFLKEDLEANGLEKVRALRYPLFVKPAWEGSSKGIRDSSRVETEAALRVELERLFASFPGEPALVERYLPGREFTVGILGNDPPKILGVMETKGRNNSPYFIYSLARKRDWEHLVTYECPPRGLAPKALAQIGAHALRLVQAFGCRDFARLDFRLDEAGEAFFLEANPLPGLNPESGDFIIMARLQGWSYERVILGILGAALERNFGKTGLLTKRV